MKKVTRILGLCALMALVTVSCKKNENTKGGVSFLASITQPTNGAKTHIGADNFLMWNENDAIKVYNTAGEAETFTTSDKDVTLATFTGDITETETYYACYPESNTIDINEATATLALNAAQQYADGGFANGAYPMVAINSGKQFNFRSPFGVLCLQLKGTATVGSIVLTDSNMGLAGDFTVALDAMTAIASSSTTGNTITLSCSEGVALNNEEAEDFFMVVPAGAFAQGFTAVVKDMYGNTIHTLATTNPNTMQAEHILTMPVVTIQYATPSVTTNDATNVAQTTATLNGAATAPAGTTLTECGFYWGTSEDALTNKVTAASATSPFSYDLTGLNAGTTYYFKAYAVNQTGENYGEVKSFTTKTPIEGRFKINDDGDFVEFAPGNLWHNDATGEWGFENSQFGYHTFPAYDGYNNPNMWGLFAWSTNTSHDYNAPFQYGVSIVDADAHGSGPGGIDPWDSPYWPFYTGTFVDWGPLMGSEWFTLSAEEWEYLLGHHVNGYCNVDGHPGFVIMPYEWDGELSYNISSERWAELEADHAAFLPGIGVRFVTTYGYGSTWFDDKPSASYWTRSLSDDSSDYPRGMNFAAFYNEGSFHYEVAEGVRAHGMCVRLVKPYVSGK